MISEIKAWQDPDNTMHLQLTMTEKDACELPTPAWHAYLEALKTLQKVYDKNAKWFS